MIQIVFGLLRFLKEKVILLLPWLVLEKEKQVLETALKGWSNSAKEEYSLAYENHLLELKQLEKALSCLKSNN